MVLRALRRCVLDNRSVPANPAVSPESIRMDLAQNARSKLSLQSSVVGLSPFLNPLGSVLKLPNQQFDFHDIPHGFEKRSHVHHGSEALSYDARSLFSCKFNSAARMDT